jgi:hypothetical protein
MVDAYSDPTFDPTTHRLHFLGGGHGDGTCNAIVTLALDTLTYSLTAPPTPSTAYPPSYLQSTTPSYPSGLPLSWFHTDAELSDPADKPYAAPVSAPLSTHQYGGQAVRYKSGGPHEIQWFYLQHKVFDLEAKQWTNAHEQGLDFISQRVGTQANAQVQDLGTNIGPTVPLQQGTMALYDDVTDSYFITLVPGDAGGGWRTFFFRYDPAGQTVPKIYRPEVPCREDMGWVRAGRWIYGITSPFSVAYPNETLNMGFRFNIDTEAVEYFNVTGDVVSFQTGVSQEAAPMWFDSSLNAFYTWNHNAQDRSGVYELREQDLGQHGGSGTAADPYLWPQQRIELSGTPPSQVTYRYNGAIYIPDWDVMVVMPASGQPLYALRM